MVSAAGRALRELKDGPVEVITRFMDFNVVTFELNGQQQTAPTNSLVSFSAPTFRELVEVEESDSHGPSTKRVLTDVWEFRIPEAGPAGGHSTSLIYIDGKDILVVKGVSKVL